MRIDESPDTGSRFLESTDRIGPALAAGCFGLASCCGVAAIYYAAILGGGSILRPSHAMLRSIGLTLTGLVSTAYYGRVALARSVDVES
jgi:hypothetical protein